MTSTIEQTEETTETKVTRKANVRARGGHRAPAKRKAGKTAALARKAPHRATNAHVRDGSKTAMILELLKRPTGATTQDLLEATGWKPHSLRGFLSGTVRKKLGLSITSKKGDDGVRKYSVKP